MFGVRDRLVSDWLDQTPWRSGLPSGVRGGA